MEIRPLHVGDIFTIGRLIEKTRAKSTASTSNPGEAWLLLVDSLVTEAADGFLAWAADLIGKEKAELEKMPADTILDIVEQLASLEDIQDFIFWIFATLSPDGRQKLVEFCDIFRRKYDLAADKVLFSDFAQITEKLIQGRQKEVADTLAEAEEIIALAKGEK